MLFQRRLFLELLRNTLLTLAMLTSVLVLLVAASIVHRTEGLSLQGFIGALPIFAATQMQITLPMSVLVAVMLTYGRAAADGEVDTLRASGIHPWHLWVPGVAFGALMSLLLLLVMDYGKPWAEMAKKRIVSETDLAALLRNKLSAGEPVQLDDDRTVISVDRFDEAGTARGLRLQLFKDDGELDREIVAESAELRVDTATALFEVTLHDYHTVRGTWLEGKSAVISRALPRDMSNLYEDHMATPQLLAELTRNGRTLGFTERELQVELETRLSTCVTPLLFVLLGLPVALLFRKHDRTMSFLVAFLIALFLYYPASEVSLALSRSEALPIGLAAWSGTAALLVVAAGLTWRVVRR